jgi:hypothetical protein
MSTVVGLVPDPTMACRLTDVSPSPERVGSRGVSLAPCRVDRRRHGDHLGIGEWWSPAGAPPALSEAAGGRPRQRRGGILRIMDPVSSPLRRSCRTSTTSDARPSSRVRPRPRLRRRSSRPCGGGPGTSGGCALGARLVGERLNPLSGAAWKMASLPRSRSRELLCLVRRDDRHTGRSVAAECQTIMTGPRCRRRSQSAGTHRAARFDTG